MNRSARGVQAFFLIAMALTIGGCGKSTQDKLVGVWKPEVGFAVFQLTFNKDGTCTFAGENARYRVDGNNVVITSSDLNGKTMDNTAAIVSLDDKKLVLKMPDGEQTFIRVQ